jgi:isoaspartyl peptidase/L-asparaginase-like protein (Ntn-hydrolase superfamily)
VQYTAVYYYCNFTYSVYTARHTQEQEEHPKTAGTAYEKVKREESAEKRAKREEKREKREEKERREKREERREKREERREKRGCFVVIVPTSVRGR